MGLIYLRARYYDPSTGRFLSKDPAGGKLSSPVTQNKYVYANNNPVNAGDPTGLVTNAEMNSWMANVPVTYWTPSGGYTSSFSAYSAAFNASRSAPVPVPDGGGRASVSSAAAPSSASLPSCSGSADVSIAAWIAGPGEALGSPPLGGSFPEVPLLPIGGEDASQRVSVSAWAYWSNGLVNYGASILQGLALNFSFTGFYQGYGFNLNQLTATNGGFLTSGGGSRARSLGSIMQVHVNQTPWAPRGFTIHPVSRDFSVSMTCS